MNYLYYEVQYFSWWVYLVIAIAIALIAWPILRGSLSLKIGLGAGVFLLVVVLMTLRMTTFVKEQSLAVYFGWIPVVTKTIPLSEIKDAQICSYHPFTQFGGWGWRYSSDGTHALTAKGTQGICFHLRNGRKVVVGSSKSQELEGVIRAHRTKPWNSGG